MLARALGYILDLIESEEGCISVTGHRFKPMFEFGFVTLDILYTYPEDSGVYECRATNAFGTDVTQATIKCRGQQAIIAETQLPGEGALRLMEMEENWRK